MTDATPVLKTLTTSVLRNVQHPWTGEPGWDILLMQSLELAAMDDALAKAEGNGWHIWSSSVEISNETGSRYLRAVLYKPQRAHIEWQDPNPWPTP